MLGDQGLRGQRSKECIATSVDALSSPAKVPPGAAVIETATGERIKDGVDASLLYSGAVIAFPEDDAFYVVSGASVVGEAVVILVHRLAEPW